MKDFEGRLAGQIDVEHASSPSEVVQNILGTALDNLSSLQVWTLIKQLAEMHGCLASHPQPCKALSVSGIPKTSSAAVRSVQKGSRNCTAAGAGLCPTEAKERSRALCQGWLWCWSLISHAATLCSTVMVDSWVISQFAAVLNEKKAKAVEWKLKAEQAQASVQKASTEVKTVNSWNFLIVLYVA